ncbi:MAG: hypothetical protein HQL46_07030 [Gammaproteobacteria bacterium]|nr:hypothetical protein [Gammaproteobacteria bacterium]
MAMDISGVSTGASFVATAQSNGDSTTANVMRKTLGTESGTETQSTQAVSQPTEAASVTQTNSKTGGLLDVTA